MKVGGSEEFLTEKKAGNAENCLLVKAHAVSWCQYGVIEYVAIYKTCKKDLSDAIQIQIASMWKNW